MGMRQFFVVFVAVLLCQSLAAREILVGMEMRPVKKMAVIFTPIVIPDLISVKAAFEVRVHRKFNVIIPVEAKWMDYRRAIKLFGSMAGKNDIPEKWYGDDEQVKPQWNIDMFQFKISSGLGVKWFPFSESMTNAFFVKTSMLAGYERLFAYSAEGRRDSAVFTHVATLGYNWVKRNRFTFGFEIGEEYTWHTNPIDKMPTIFISGLMPIFQLSLGFTI